MAKKFKNMSEMARELGLSRCAVSYILNNKWRENHISEETAQRVLDFSAKSGFVPNPLSMALKGKVSVDTAILLPPNCLDHEKRAFFEFIRMIDGMGLTYMVLPLKGGGDSRSAALQLASYKVKNAIALSGLMRPDDKKRWVDTAANTDGVRWLFYDFRFDGFNMGDLPGKNTAYIGFKSLAAVKNLFRHTAEAGYKNLIVDCGTRSQEELISFIRGLGFSRVMFYDWPPPAANLPERGRAVGDLILRLPKTDGPAAVHINDDLMTIGAINRVMEAGVRVPEEMAFISWDGLPESAWFTIPLTTLVIPHDEMLDHTRRWLAGEKSGPVIEVTPYIRPGRSLPDLIPRA
jgi:DNA-binding LacI/PurR family transcriptional regulator